MIRHSVANNAFTTLAVGVIPADETITVVASILDDIPVPFFADIGSELIAVTDVDPEDLVSHWDVIREVAGSAGTYAIGVPVVQRIYAEQINELNRLTLALERVICELLGENDGVVQSYTRDDNLEVVLATGITATLTRGSGTLGSDLFAVLEDTTLTFERPGAGTRVDLVQISNTGVVSIKPGSTTPHANNLALAEVTVPSAGDIATIVDVRVFT